MAEIDELRAQPQDILAEQSVLGAIFIDESKLVFVREYIEPADFFKYANRLIFKAMIDLADRGDAIDATTVRNILDSQGDLQNIGGLSYLVEVVNSVPTSANAEYYAKIVAEKAILRRLISRLTESINQAYDGDRLSEEIIAGAEKALIDVSETANRSGFKNIRDVLNLNFGNLEARSLQTSDITGIATGYRELDKMTSGWQNSDLVILAARPAMGKTAFALSMAKNIAVDQGIPVAVFSLEMANVQLVNRVISNTCEIESEKIKSGQLEPHEWAQLDSKIKDLYGKPMFVDDTPALSVFELRTKARRLVREHGIKVLMVDYLQLMNANGMRFSSRQEEVSTISRSLKGLAKELNIPVLALSQLNRTVEQRDGIEGKRPQLSDLRESGAIEQDADLVLFVHRPEYYRIFQDEKGNDLHGKAQIIIAKHRKGATDDVLLSFRGEYTRFANPDEDSFMPAGLPNDFGGEIIGSKMNDDPLPPPDDRPPF